MNVLSRISESIGHLFNNKVDISDRNNPDNETKEQVSLGNVDNTSDIDKNVSTDQKTEIDSRVNKSDFERYFKFQNWKNRISGGGDITWNGHNLSTSNRLIVVPTNENNGFININLTNLNIPDLNIAYVDLTDPQLRQNNLKLTQDDFTVKSCTSYTESTSQNRFVLGYCNDCTGEFVFSNGLTVNNMNNRDTGWINAKYQNDWVSYGGDFQVARYRKIGSIVHIEGLVKDGKINLPVFTLPAGFRPTEKIIKYAANSGDFGRLDIDSNGSVLPFTGSNLWFNIECSFSV